ncbi:DUF6538 domain-containing protein [uncultured Bilophila sp.]|uniref:DUF6538 domain-containing protein n=1 Tax=uncultured Bilophila sp. TaxID=529385 RepID=UPI0035A666B3
MDALSLSSNIVRRGAVYYIRVRVPSDLLDYYAPKKEITYSLKTKAPREAKRKGNLGGRLASSLRARRSQMQRPRTHPFQSQYPSAAAGGLPFSPEIKRGSRSLPAPCPYGR